MNLKDLSQFAGRDGKVLVVGEDGEVKGVFLNYAEYVKLSGGQIAVVPGPDPEKVNREILDAQLTDTVGLTNKNLETISEIDSADLIAPVVPAPVAMPTPIKNILSRRAKDLFMNQPYGRQEPPEYDLREEVMDPNFDLPTAPSNSPVVSPQVETELDEEIKPNFDDI